MKYTNGTSRTTVLGRIAYTQNKMADRGHLSIPEWITIMEYHLAAAKKAYVKGLDSLDGLVKAVAVGVSCMETHGYISND